MSTATETTVKAFDLYARLQGIDVSQITNANDEAPESIDIDVDIEVEETPKKKRSKGTRSVKKEEPKPVMYTVPELPEFEVLNRGLKITMTQKSHDIKYKEQSWGIPVRQIEYNIEIVRQQKVARDIATKFTNADIDRDKAVKGLVRYFKIISYENIPYRSREIGYIRVTKEQGDKLKAKLILNKQAMKENNLDPDEATQAVHKIIEKLLGRTNKK